MPLFSSLKTPVAESSVIPAESSIVRFVVKIVAGSLVNNIGRELVPLKDTADTVFLQSSELHSTSSSRASPLTVKLPLTFAPLPHWAVSYF